MRIPVANVLVAISLLLPSLGAQDAPDSSAPVAEGLPKTQNQAVGHRLARIAHGADSLPILLKNFLRGFNPGTQVALGTLEYLNGRNLSPIVIDTGVAVSG